MAKIQVRRDTAANWTQANPTLAAGEIGFETDTGKLKIGTGSAAWSALAYFAGSLAAHNHTISEITDLDGVISDLAVNIINLQSDVKAKVPLIANHTAGTFVSTANSPYLLTYHALDTNREMQLGATDATSQGLLLRAYRAGQPELDGVISLNETGTGSNYGRLDVLLTKETGNVPVTGGLAVYPDRIERVQVGGTPNWTAESLLTQGRADARYLTTTQPVLTGYREAYASAAITGGVLTLNLATSNTFRVDLGAAITSLVINGTDAAYACSFTLVLTASGTAKPITWPTSIRWPGGTAPTLTITAGKKDVLSFITFDGGFSWLGFIGGLNL